MRQEAWAYVSGVCAAREAEFLTPRFTDELAALPPEQVSARLQRSFFGPAEPLTAFDRFARERRNREFDEIGKVCPDSLPMKLVQMDLAADKMRKSLADIPEHIDAAELVRVMQKLALRAGHFADDFANAFPKQAHQPEPSARVAASLIIDSSELLMGLDAAEKSGDRVVKEWARERARVGSGKVAMRLISLGIPKEPARAFFFRDKLLTQEAKDFLVDYDEASARRLYPHGVHPGHEDEYLVRVAEAAKGEPFSAARVLHYLLSYMEQEKRLRMAVYVSLGRIAKEEAA
jgi:hypothetical protein